jgi:hypothetical protein
LTARAWLIGQSPVTASGGVDGRAETDECQLAIAVHFRELTDRLEP